MVAGWGCAAATAEGAEPALTMLGEATEAGHPYDVILLDLCMPDIDGFGLARLILDDARLAAIPMIMLTSSAQRGEPERAHNAGIMAYLTKPVRASQLRSALNVVFGPAALPDRLDDPGSDRATGPRRTSRRPAASRPHDEKVLLVEDNLVNQKVFVAMLTNIGYQVEVAGDGLGALDSLARHRYSAVLMDCQMPGMDGFEATEELRRREGTERHTPVIALTASAMATDRTRCIEAGMDDYLTKPLNAQALTAALDHWLPRDDPTGRWTRPAHQAAN
jgi:two-component system, sensor histidine kinase and response regulator